MFSTDHDIEIENLHRQRPRSGFVRWSLALLALLFVAVWFIGDWKLSEFDIDKRIRNFQRNITDFTPYPLQQGEGWAAVFHWARDLLTRDGAVALLNTFSIAVTSIVLAAAMGYISAPAAARTLAIPSPFFPGTRHSSADGVATLLWGSLRGIVRSGFVLLRAVPEYLLAFLFLAMLGPQAGAWPAVLALSLHNGGILGRLGSEVIENAPDRASAALRAAGASRLELAAISILPESLPRLLVYFLYRWENCVRDATVLGMLGFTSIGFFLCRNPALTTATTKCSSLYCSPLASFSPGTWRLHSHADGSGGQGENQNGYPKSRRAWWRSFEQRLNTGHSGLVPSA